MLFQDFDFASAVRPQPSSSRKPRKASSLHATAAEIKAESLENPEDGAVAGHPYDPEYYPDGSSKPPCPVAPKAKNIRNDGQSAFCLLKPLAWPCGDLYSMQSSLLAVFSLRGKLANWKFTSAPKAQLM